MPDAGAAADERLMRRALALAARAAGAGEVPVGAVLVSGDCIVEAQNEKETRPDPTAHAEIRLLQKAARRLGVWRLGDATVYVTKEPCAMCAGALVAARVKRVVYATRDPKGGADGSVFDILRSDRSNHRIEVTAGVLEDEASEQLRRFFRSKRRPGEEEFPSRPA